MSEDKKKTEKKVHKKPTEELDIDEIVFIQSLSTFGEALEKTFEKPVKKPLKKDKKE